MEQRRTAEESSGGQCWHAESLLAKMPGDMRGELLALGSLRVYERGEIILLEGERSTHVCLLEDACVKVTASTEEGQTALLAIRFGGDMVGELSCLDSQPRLATATAARRSSVRMITQSEFRAFLARSPRAAMVFASSVGAKLRSATRRQVDFSGREAKVRLARVLVELASIHGRPAGRGVLIGVLLTQPELAALVGAAETTVHKALAALRRRNVVSTGYRRITVLDLEALRSAAGLPSAAGK